MNDAFPLLGDARVHDTRWRLRLLGDVALHDGLGATLRLPGRVPTLLLARLALSPDRAQARETLIELLWPGVALDVGRNRLRQALSTLKALLEGPGADGAVLLADRQAVRLGPGALACDVVDFEQALRQGRHDEAAQLYRGELLPGHYDDWVHDERQRLAALADALAPAPGRVAPPPPLAAAPTAGQTALNLPHYLTRLHGADAVGARLLADVQAHRLVTLLGPGGHGKTRLAVEVARALLHSQHGDARLPGAAPPARAPFDLVAFVPLVACPGGAALPTSLHAALLLALRQDARGAAPLEALQTLLAGRQALLVLDNFEQLVDGGAAVLAELLSRCPRLHLLVTSRRALGLDGEHERVLPPLPLPAPDAGDAEQAALNPAVALFVDRARAVRADFRLDEAHCAPVLALVRHLQGMPLAIELAASRVRSLSPAALLTLLQAARADGDPGAALALLARSGPRAAADPRHASMLAVVQWSWQLLSPAAQQMLPRLSGFAGRFTLAAASAVAGAGAPAGTVAQALDELVAHSMLRADGERFELYELIREFAATLLSPADARALRARHRRWLTAWFDALPRAAPLQQVRPEVANLVAALLGAEADGAPAEAIALAAAAQTALSAISLPAPVLAALQRCADALDDGPARSVARAALARAMLLAGRIETADLLARQALDELPAACATPDGAPPGLARALVLTRVAHVRWRLQRDPAVRAWLEEALALAECARAPALQATILTNLGALHRARDAQAGIALQRRALALWSAAGDVHGVNVGRCNLALALMASAQGAAEALALAAQAMRDTRAQGDEMQYALACNLAGEAQSRLGEWRAAAEAYRECIAAAFAAAEPWPLAYGLWNLPRAWAHLRRHPDAARLMGFAERHALGVTGPLTPADRHDLRRLRRLCETGAAPSAVARWWQDGAAMDLAAAVRLATAP